jgi:hypothetical protein
MRKAIVALMAAFSAACGYHISGRGDMVPKTVKTIAVPAFGNGTTRYTLSRLVTADVTREFNSRARYNIIPDPDQADAVLSGTVLNFFYNPTILDPVTFRATGVQVIVTVQVTLTDRHTGKVLFSRPSMEIRERYEISTDPQTYFDESGTAIERLSRDVARSVVSAILESF